MLSLVKVVVAANKGRMLLSMQVCWTLLVEEIDGDIYLFFLLIKLWSIDKNINNLGRSTGGRAPTQRGHHDPHGFESQEGESQNSKRTVFEVGRAAQ